MKGITNEIKVLMLCFLALLLQSALVPMLSWVNFVPLIFLPTTLFVGVSNFFSLSRGALLSFLVGYLTDFFSGASMGVHALVAVTVFLLTRGAGLRLFFRGPFFQIVLTFLISLLAAGSMLALRAIFEPHPTPVVMQASTSFRFLLGTSVTTALIAPLLFGLFRLILKDVDLNQKPEHGARTIA